MDAGLIAQVLLGALAVLAAVIAPASLRNRLAGALIVGCLLYTSRCV